MKKIILSALLLLVSNMAMAMNTGGYFQVTQVYAWSGTSTGGSGYILVKLEDSNALCPDGYWLQDTPTSHASNYIMDIALLAYNTKSRVLIYADENSDWPHLPTKECEIQMIVLDD